MADPRALPLVEGLLDRNEPLGAAACAGEAERLKSEPSGVRSDSIGEGSFCSKIPSGLLKESRPTRNRCVGGFRLSRHKLLIIATIATLAGPGAVGQSDSLGQIRFLEGKWEGTATGEPGKGVSTREYRLDLNGRFLSARNKSVYEPKSPETKAECTRTLECTATIAR